MMKKILMFSSIDVSKNNACTIHYFSLANFFSKAGYQVEVVVPKPKAQYAFEIDLQHIKLHERFSAAKLNLPNFCSGLFQIPWLIGYLRNNHGSIFYTRNNEASFITLFFVRLFTKTYIVSEHNGWLTDEVLVLRKSFILSKLAKISQYLDARFSHLIRAVTPGIKRKLTEVGVDDNKIFVVGNGTNTAFFSEQCALQSRQALKLNPEYFYLGFIGTLAPWQGLHYALYALRRVVKQMPKVQLIIAGEGPERDNLVSLTEILNLQNNVCFLGNVNQEKLNLVLNAIDIALAPFTQARNSNIGISPLKIRDYAASGKPTIASDLEGIRELETAGWLILHKPDDIDDLAQKIIELMQDANKRVAMSLQARKYAKEHFDYSVVASKILATIQEKMPFSQGLGSSILETPS